MILTLGFISACASTLNMDEQNVLAPISEHQSLFIIQYEPKQSWIDNSDIQSEFFSSWLVAGFNHALSKNDIPSDGAVWPQENQKQVKKEIKSSMKTLKPQAMLTLIPVKASGFMQTPTSGRYESFTYKLNFYSYKGKKKVKVWESKLFYTIPNAMFEKDPEKLSHLYADNFVKEVLTELQKVGLLSPSAQFTL